MFTIRTADIGKFPWFNTEVCQFGPTAAMSYTLIYTNIDGITKSASEHRSAGIGGWNTYGVELRWKSTDLNSAPATTFVSPTTSATTTTTTTTTGGFSDLYPGLSTGAKAGIGVDARGFDFSWTKTRRERRERRFRRLTSRKKSTQNARIRLQFSFRDGWLSRSISTIARISRAGRAKF